MYIYIIIHINKDQILVFDVFDSCPVLLAVIRLIEVTTKKVKV